MTQSILRRSALVGAPGVFAPSAAENALVVGAAVGSNVDVPKLAIQAPRHFAGHARAAFRP
ncbi:hypothetical protein [Pseudorhodoferax soli]|uniref:Uncharacterized protein n=1 Tax=Pseudorhodoferax soli TaxID=545864 RepID=A0A368XTM8_9BURK|nr:hypothetical protein [Pseudorhodoferax soli]RCW71410.1 hypothetical protein DES41_104229 [Pseudorhodoferax soli]